MDAKIEELLRQVKRCVEEVNVLLTQSLNEDIISPINTLIKCVYVMQNVIPEVDYKEYKDYFESFSAFCKQCTNLEFLQENLEMLASSVKVFGECVEALQGEQAPCTALSSDDALMISFLEYIELNKVVGGESLLQIESDATIEHWIYGNCPALTYNTTDLYEMNIADESYDYCICSYLPENMQEAANTLQELYRILKKDGMGMFFSSLPLEDVLNQIPESDFFVHMLENEFSVLYVLVKQEGELEDLINQKKNDREKAKRDEPLVSVILPSYNHEKYIGEAIESVLNQTYRNIEFLIADDASTDGTVEKILQYEDKIDQIHLFEENTKGKVTQFLREQAKGKYIAVMHSDDVWAPDKLEMQVAYMENHPECGACFTGCDCIDEDGVKKNNALFYEGNMKKEQWLRYFYEHSNCLVHPSILIHRELYIDLFIRSGAQMFWQLPDYWMWVNLVQQKEIHIIEKKLTFFRWHEKSENKNISAGTKESEKRHKVEETYIWYNTFKKLDDKFFLEAFGDMLIKKDASSEMEVMCEKLFVLLRPRLQCFKQAAVFYMYDICQVPGMLEFLEREYQWNRNKILQVAASMYE